MHSLSRKNEIRVQCTISYLKLSHGNATGSVGADTLTEHLASSIKVVQGGDNLAKELHDGQSLLLESLIGPQLSTNSSAGELGEEADVTRVGQQIPVNQVDELLVYCATPNI